VLVSSTAVVWLAFSVGSPLSEGGMLRRRSDAAMARIEHDATPLRAQVNAKEAAELDGLLTEAKRLKSEDQAPGLEELTTRLHDFSIEVDRRQNLERQLRQTGNEVDRFGREISATATQEITRQEAERLVNLAVKAKASRDLAALEALSTQLNDLHAKAEKQRADANRLAALTGEIDRLGQAVKAVAKEDRARSEVEQVLAQATAAKVAENLDQLQRARDALAQLNDQTQLEYTVDVVAKPGQKSAIDRYYNDKDGKRVSGYYVIVEAHDDRGELLTRRIHNNETDRYENVQHWAERVPKEVYDRLKHDKVEDGILNETAFAIKPRGAVSERILMKDAAGQPLERLGQITQW